LIFSNLVNHLRGFFEVGSNFLIKGPPVGEDLHVKLEKSIPTSRTQLAEPSALAYQRNLAVV
jgi:hypothetical protein